MSIKALENLADLPQPQLQREAVAVTDLVEIEGLLSSGAHRLKDAGNESLSIESRFDLTYNAAHALALASLRLHGYRSNNRYIVFQALPHTLNVAKEQVRVLDSAHKKRNSSEYDGVFDVDKALVESLIRVTIGIEAAVCALLAAKREELG